MSLARVTAPRERRPQACADCLRRTWLVARLAGRIELARHAGRGAGAGALRELLALPDATLLAAIAGQERPRDRARARAGRARRPAPACARPGSRPSAATTRTTRPPAAPRRRARRPARDRRRCRPAGALAGGTLADGPDAVAIVGTRRASADGLEVARALGRGLAAAGVTVVSGMALGVDSAAHAGALDGRRGHGRRARRRRRRALPAQQARAVRRIVRAGCVVSELPPGFGPHRWCFPGAQPDHRALAQMTVVVEAAERSGSLITAELAADLGRDVGAVPGPVTSWRAAGANALLRDGATVVRDARDVLDAVVGVEGEPGTTADAPRSPGRPPSRRRTRAAPAPTCWTRWTPAATRSRRSPVTRSTSPRSSPV